MSDAKYNWSAIIFYALLAAALALCVLYMLGNKTPFQAWANNTFAAIIAKVQGLNVGGFDIGKLLNDNKGMLLGVGIAAVPLIIANVKSYLDKEAVEKQLANKAAELSLTKKSAEETIANTQLSYQQQLLDQKNKIAELESEGNLAEAQKIISTQSVEIQKLQSQLSDLTQLKTVTPEQVQAMIKQSQATP